MRKREREVKSRRMRGRGRVREGHIVNVPLYARGAATHITEKLRGRRFVPYGALGSNCGIAVGGGGLRLRRVSMTLENLWGNLGGSLDAYILRYRYFLLGGGGGR